MKKILTTILTLSLTLSLGTTAFALDSTSKEDEEIFIDNSSDELIEEKNQNLLDEDTNITMYNFASELTEDEIVALEEIYNEIIEYSANGNIPLNLELETFIYEYKKYSYSSIDEYADVYYALLIPIENSENGTRSGGGSDYYYNIGNSLSSTVTPNYSKYNLLTTIQKGDVIYEANGGFGITGHIAIVEGFYYSKARDITYIRIIEAIGDGVVRSLLDDTRVDQKDATVLRVSGASTSIRNGAISFCVGELGSSYFIDFKKDTSSKETDWYCSELVWAGYYNKGIDIERNSFLSEPGVTPRDIYNCDNLYSINFR